MLTALFTLAMLQTQPPSIAPVAAFVPVHDRESIVVDSLEAAELRFFYHWGDAFTLSRDHDRPFEGQWSLRQVMIECTRWQDRPLGAETIAPWKGQIVSTTSSFALCPSWQVSDSLPHDESRGIDNSLDTRFHVAVKASRNVLIDRFTAASRTYPGNGWIAGQLVRLLIDQGEFDRALEAAQGCRALQSWCSALTGLALAKLSDIPSADSAFDVALTTMPALERCRWADLGALLDSADRAAYNETRCEDRDSLHTVVWWLADPLWTATGNERRVEHFTRRVMVDLRAALRRDERWAWRRELGGDALQDMLLRYGWPTYTWWPGIRHDRARTGRYMVTTYRSSFNPPYTTFEYSDGRLQTFPRFAVMANPLAAERTDWELASPTPITRLTKATDSTRKTSLSFRTLIRRTDEWWWPSNHFAPRRSIVQLPAGESIFLRRQRGAVFATVIESKNSQYAPLSQSKAMATLVSTVRPDEIDTIVVSPVQPGPRIVLHGVVKSRPQLLGIEAFGSSDSVSPAFRTRFGVAPPPPLSTFRADEQAISDIVMLDAPAPGGALPSNLDTLLQQMRPGIVAPRAARFALYWETYGVRAADTVDISVWIERHTDQGTLRSLGIAMNIVTDLNTPVAISWREPGAGRVTHVIDGQVPIIGRCIVLDPGTLATGDYWLRVVVRRVGGEPMESRRSFTVRAQ